MVSHERRFGSTSAASGCAVILLVIVSAACSQPPETESQPAVAEAPAAAPVAAPRATVGELAAILDDRAGTSASSSAGAAAAAAQAPGSPEGSFRALLDETVKTAGELKRVDEEYAALKPQVEAWQARLAQHNANPCTYPEDQPDVCAEYDSNAAALNAERDRLVAAVDANEAQWKEISGRLGFLKARLRITAALTFDCECVGLAPEAEKACWDECFDKVDPGLKSCLDIADLDQFAYCLAP